MILSLFSGLGVLDLGFEELGWCVVHGPDLLWSRDVRAFHPPADVFEGIIGGDPCQSHSSLANLVRAKGLEPRYPDLTPEFQRVVEEARPKWFLRENVPKAPDIEPDGYEVTSFLLDNCWLGEAQMRKRRFWFGWRQERGPAPNLRRWIPGEAFELPTAVQAVTHDNRAVPVRHGGHDGTADAIGGYRRHRDMLAKQAPVTGRHDGAVGAIDKDYSPPRRSLAEMLELQGLPPDWLDEAPWTMAAKRKMVGNAVTLPMSLALAVAVRKSLESA